MTSIHDVAHAAGVSISTVSYALSGKRSVSEKTRRRIEQAVQDLGYQPNAGARMLAGRRTNIFALTEPLRLDTHTPTHMTFVLASTGPSRLPRGTTDPALPCTSTPVVETLRQFPHRR